MLGISDSSKFQFIIAESCFGMMCYFSKNPCFDFVSNIIANLACLAEGRQFMIENKYIEAIVVQMVTKFLNNHRRKYLMTCLRNLLFEYDKFQDKFHEMNVPRDICKVLIDEQGITGDRLPDSWKFCQAKKSKEKSEIDMENSSCMIDCLVLLANSDKLLERMHEINMEAILKQLYITEEFEDTKDRILVLESQLATAGSKDKDAPAGETGENADAMPHLEEQQ